MKKRLQQFIYPLCLVLLVGAPLLLTPWLFLYGNRQVVYDTPVRPGTNITINFIHSVQKTPVWEYLVVNDKADGFRLQSTKYQSFGVGLPFMESDGTFRKEGDYFIMDNMNREFPQLHLRTGVGTKLTISIGTDTYPIYEQVPLGSPVDIKVVPLYRYFME